MTVPSKMVLFKQAPTRKRENLYGEVGKLTMQICLWTPWWAENDCFAAYSIVAVAEGKKPKKVVSDLVKVNMTL